ncbi:hypothetical protein Ndes2526B_g02152 [Nannochloris sp. 'desiccata']|nr:hypothetical protein KSW81_003487 [Chlorella desiccata (nom. nud.)]KAH7622869.1 hypothetical protein NADE_007738 [Chlorella desiccata (nom. nud.)]
MVSPWWGLGVAVPAMAIRAFSGRGKGQNREDEPLSRLDDGTEPSFICERVCTSDRMMRRMGGLAKEATPNTCVTVCGVSALDACTEACQQAVCSSMHQVPAWNEACITRCSTECTRGRTA